MLWQLVKDPTHFNSQLKFSSLESYGTHAHQGSYCPNSQDHIKVIIYYIIVYFCLLLFSLY